MIKDVKCKGKAVPLQAWSGPEDSRKLRFPDFLTTAQKGGKVVSLTHRPPLINKIYLHSTHYKQASVNSTKSEVPVADPLLWWGKCVFTT
jgi:hypothetical protein